jgi:hypothetical protein
MKKFESGVSRYIKGKCTVEVSFPVDHKGNADICCKRCKLFMMRSYVATCALTGEIVPYPDNYVGVNCPLEVENENEST